MNFRRTSDFRVRGSRIDGYFFVAVSGTSAVRKDLANQVWQCGAPLYWAPCTRSRENHEIRQRRSRQQLRLTSLLTEQ